MGGSTGKKENTGIHEFNSRSADEQRAAFVIEIMEDEITQENKIPNLRTDISLPLNFLAST